MGVGRPKLHGKRGIGSLCIIALLLIHSCVFAMPPHPSLIESAKASGKPLDTLLCCPTFRLGLNSKPMSVQPPPDVAPSGSYNVLVILMNFDDTAANPPAGDGDEPALNFQSMLFSTGTYPTGSMNDYFREVSYGVFGVDGAASQIVGWFTAPKVKASYDESGVYPDNVANLVEEAVAAADADGVDFSQYDNDGDGAVDSLFIVGAGQGQERSGDPNDIWSHRWSITGGGGTAQTIDGVQVDDYSIQPEWGAAGQISSIGVYCHEYAHLFGVPDLYDTDYSSVGIGVFGLMGSGGWNGAVMGTKPAHLCAWSKQYMKWVTPTNVTADGTYTIGDVVNNDTVYRVWSNGTAWSEYFLLENRQQNGFDIGLPGSGLLIWHIDETRLSLHAPNDDESRKLVDLEEADGLTELDSYTSNGDSADFFYSTNNDSFGDTTTPNSKTNDSQSTSVQISSISASGDAMTAVINVTGDVDPPPPGDGNEDDDNLPGTASSDIPTTVIQINVPEAGETTFGVKLGSDPQAPIIVTVAHTSGEASITVTQGWSLSFNSSNWDTYQTVTLAASEDNLLSEKTALITCSSSGLNSAVVAARKWDNDRMRPISGGGGGGGCFLSLQHEDTDCPR